MIAIYRGVEIGSATIAPDGKLHVFQEGNEVPITEEMKIEIELSCKNKAGSESSPQHHAISPRTTKWHGIIVDGCND